MKRPIARKMLMLIPAVTLSTAACTSTLVDYESRAVRMHVVQPGETLHTIAWRYGVDHRELARWNRLDNPDLILVGQRIMLGPTATAATTAAPPQGSAPPASRPSPSPQPGRAAAPLPPPPQLPPPSWQWPTEGTVVSRFGNSSANSIGSGIAIGGRGGQPVRAAAPGRVVYAGGGLIGYGQLLIIMHNDTYLTAYGHNARLLVAQGDTVARGQQIAEMGLGPEREPRLHFEIRRNGVPVDPLPYLATAAR
jgi:lipoprotein NlpD